MNDGKLLILGASTRAAAQSARRAGLQPVCADLFADTDLRDTAEVLPVRDYPHGLLDAARKAPACPWIYTGALENHPQLIAAVSAERPLLGNSPDTLENIRDPFRVHALLKEAGLPALAVRPGDDPPPPSGGWLRKPVRSAAGRNIRVWDRAACEPHVIREAFYFQQRAAGEPISAVFLAMPERTLLVGIARQLVGPTDDGVPPFTYYGSIGPIHPGPRIVEQVRRTGETLAEACGLRGLFGGDFLCDGTTARLTEVNPRYTASVEIFEYAWSVSLLDAHVEVCWHADRPSSFPGSAWERASAKLCFAGGKRSFGDNRSQAELRNKVNRIVGKRILYAPRDIVGPSLERLRDGADAEPVPPLADIPAAGTPVRAGEPLCTVMALERDVDKCAELLQRKATDLLRQTSS